jgi:hypothetical protein
VRQKERTVKEKKKPGNPGKENKNYHEGQCAVCSHDDRAEIERRYLAFESGASIARDYTGLSDDSILRHGQYFGLNLKRVQDSRRVYRTIVAHGLPVILNSTDDKIMAAVTLDALKQLDKIDGNEQMPRQNDADVERRRRMFTDAINELMAGGMTEAQARAWLTENYPEAERVM